MNLFYLVIFHKTFRWLDSAIIHGIDVFFSFVCVFFGEGVYETFHFLF